MILILIIDRDIQILYELKSYKNLKSGWWMLDEK